MIREMRGMIFPLGRMVPMQRPAQRARTLGANSALRRPVGLTPLAADQPSWARVVHALGAGPAPVPFRTLTAHRLAAAISQAVNDQAIRRRAAEVGRQIQAEDGPGRVIELFTQHAEGKTEPGDGPVGARS
jgi:hypothetical protein